MIRSADELPRLSPNLHAFAMADWRWNLNVRVNETGRKGR
jgi:hypothetical protein